MGNTISYIGSHGKRLLNRYNAQFRALKFIEKEKLPSAPRHALPPNIEEDPVIYEQLLKKDPSLDTYLKDVYIKSYSEESLATGQKNSKRPLPVYTGPPKKNTFQESVEMIIGLCTLSQFFEFRSAHESDPIENSAAVIARNYSLDVKKVENLLKYYSMFTVHKVVWKESQSNELDDLILPELPETTEKENKKLEEGKKESKDKIEKELLELESRQAKN